MHANPPIGPFSVSEPVYCALTRFGFRSPRHLRATRREFTQVARAAADVGVPGLLRSVFLTEGDRAAFTLSLWSAEPQISALVGAHVDAANHVFGRLAQEAGAGPELWSTQWRLESVSNNLRWRGFNLSAWLGDLEPVGHERGSKA